jgi:hypothetical protein
MQDNEKYQNHGGIEEDIQNRSMQPGKEKKGEENYITK